VTLAITALANDAIESPIVGFFLRNRLGLNVFGDNTYLVHRAEPLRFARGTVFVARFEFLMPYLPRGEYAFCAAVATGSNQDHVQQHWMNEALLLTSLSSEVHADVMGLPMLAIGIEAQ
jgi:lipopolysaccharide transport system ATP-binding protein